ncbi:Cell division protein FtsZ [bacterium HR23]|nr:Cell division protein FtsZ [bacterium HR23]
MVDTAARPTRKPRVREAPASIAVVGVGGGGCNAVVRMLKEQKQVPGVRYICANTDIKSLERVQGATVVHIGERLTHGLGAGGNPEVGAQAAESARSALKKAIGRADLVFLCAGMGGGTGTGAAPTVAEIAKETGALVVAVVTTPFSFEGARRLETAHAGIARLRDKVDNLIVIHNDRLLKLFKRDVPIEQALLMADEAVMLGVLSVAELINVPGEINVDMADVKTIMKLPGHALMALGTGKGPGGALEAARQAVSNPLLDISIEGAKGVLFNVNGGPSLTLGEVNATGEFIATKVDPQAIIFFGMVNDPNMGDSVRITVIATGIPDKPPRPASNSPSLWEAPRKS